MNKDSVDIQEKIKKELKRKPKETIPHDVLHLAIEDVENKKNGLRKAAQHYGIAKTTLARYVKNSKVPTPEQFLSVRLTPEDIWPFPNAQARKQLVCGRKPGRTRILTSTPEKEAIETAEAIKSIKAKIESLAVQEF
ncbi:CENP-B N-terminal DNA-binding domain [Popillia japonica]|uniref:CENP-B N-terminal DNA-binding domain n=1 Tax=Popillia japonica TaxID=7064 RepID=A0AAW1JZT9_POPJA